MGRMVANLGGGIFALIETLGDHWGAVQRDMIHAGFTYDAELGEEGGRVLSFSSLATWVTYAPHNTAIQFARTEGWTQGDHHTAQILDCQKGLLWLKSEDATKPPELQQFRPTPTPRPGVEYVEVKPQDDGKLTVESYLTKVGLHIIE